MILIDASYNEVRFDVPNIFIKWHLVCLSRKNY